VTTAFTRALYRSIGSGPYPQKGRGKKGKKKREAACLSPAVLWRRRSRPDSKVKREKKKKKRRGRKKRAADSLSSYIVKKGVRTRTTFSNT